MVRVTGEGREPPEIKSPREMKKLGEMIQWQKGREEERKGEKETPPHSRIPFFEESLVLLGSHRDDKSVEFGSTDKDKIFFHIRIWLRLGFS